jgi:uncharacterized protein YciI
MPVFAVLLEDDAQRAAEVRQQVMPDHLDFLDRVAAQIRSAGPLQDSAAGTPAGGLWIVAAADPAQVMKLVHEDPFWAAGLRRSVRILEWRQVFADGRRT